MCSIVIDYMLIFIPYMHPPSLFFVCEVVYL